MKNNQNFLDFASVEMLEEIFNRSAFFGAENNNLEGMSFGGLHFVCCGFLVSKNVGKVACMEVFDKDEPTGEMHYFGQFGMVEKSKGDENEFVYVVKKNEECEDWTADVLLEFANKMNGQNVVGFGYMSSLIDHSLHQNEDAFLKMKTNEELDEMAVSQLSAND